MADARHGMAPAAVREIQVSAINAPLEIAGDYSRAFVVLRYGVAVVGQAWLPVKRGAVSSADLQAAAERTTWPIWQREVAGNRAQGGPLPSATVAVCTRDRPDDMARCLPSLDRIAADGHEVLVIDNNPSTDATARLVAGYPRIRYVYEQRPGLDVARNRALLESRSAIVAFTDDDAAVDPGWLDALRSGFADPTVALVTGITMPMELETPAQIWFEQTNGFGRGFERRAFDLDSIEPLGSGRIGAGVNMAIRRSAVQRIGLFDEALDGGSASLSGGDQEFFYRVITRGFRAVYEPSALVWHRHRPEWDALQRCIYGYGVGLFAWWTRAFLVENDWSALKIGATWFVEYHVRNALRAALRRPGHPPPDLAYAELLGALRGPGAYLKARANLRRRDAARAAKPATAPTTISEAP